MTIIKIEHSFDSIEEAAALKRLVNCNESYECIASIDDYIRAKLKYGEESWLDDASAIDYLESIRDLIHQSGLFIYD